MRARWQVLAIALPVARSNARSYPAGVVVPRWGHHRDPEITINSQLRRNAPFATDDTQSDPRFLSGPRGVVEDGAADDPDDPREERLRTETPSPRASPGRSPPPVSHV